MPTNIPRSPRPNPDEDWPPPVFVAILYGLLMAAALWGGIIFATKELL